MKMSDYILREDAIDDLHTQLMYRMGSDDMKRRLDDWVKTLPSADVAPVVHAYWIPQKENHEFKEARMNCSACGYPVSMWTGNTNFCPNCGARMDGGDGREID